MTAAPQATFSNLVDIAIAQELQEVKANPQFIGIAVREEVLQRIDSLLATHANGESFLLLGTYHLWHVNDASQIQINRVARRITDLLLSGLSKEEINAVEDDVTPGLIALGTRRVAAKSVDGFDDLPAEKRIVWLLLHDLMDRNGFKQMHHSLPLAIKDEIQEVWQTLVKNEIEG